MDPELSAAYCRAYNRWIADFCRDSGGRLIPIAHLSLGDPAAAAEELERAVARWLPRRLRVPVHDHARSPRRPPARPRSSPPRRTSTCRSRSIRRSSPRVGHSPSLRQVRLGGVVLRSLRRPGRPARVRDVLPARRLPPLPPPARRRPRVPGRLDRLLPGPRRRDLLRNHARRHGPAGGTAVVLLGSASATSRPIPTSAPSPR